MLQLVNIEDGWKKKSEFLFVPWPQIISLGGKFSYYLTSHFWPRGREFDSNLLENVTIPPYAPPLPRWLDIDRCINDWSRGEQWILFPENLNVSRDEVEGNIEIRAITCNSGQQWTVDRVTVNCFPFDVIAYAMLPAHGIWRETVSLLDVMWPWTSQWMGAM